MTVSPGLTAPIFPARSPTSQVKICSSRDEHRGLPQDLHSRPGEQTNDNRKVGINLLIGSGDLGEIRLDGKERARHHHADSGVGGPEITRSLPRPCMHVIILIILNYHTMNHMIILILLCFSLSV